MSERNYYVICDDNCKFESMTKEQIIEAIAEATGETPVHIDDAFITKLKEQNHNSALKMWVGTQSEYNAIETKEPDVLYLITDANEIDDLEASINAVSSRVAILENSTTADLLWTNPIQTPPFDGTTINLDLSNYNLVFIEMYAGTNVILIVDGQKDSSLFDAPYIGKRDFIASTDGVEVYDGINYPTYGNWSIVENNNYSIPIRIYGIR